MSIQKLTQQPQPHHNTPKKPNKLRIIVFCLQMCCISEPLQEVADASDIESNRESGLLSYESRRMQVSPDIEKDMEWS